MSTFREYVMVPADEMTRLTDEYKGSLTENMRLTKAQVPFSRGLHQNHTVCIKIQHPFVQQFSSFIETQARPAGSETGHEDIQIGGDILT